MNDKIRDLKFVKSVMLLVAGGKVLQSLDLGVTVSFKNCLINESK